ncbi:MAG TPA: DUF2203 domain-containing protein [Verrucomicrobiae bacterium]|jgi:hypothetical protein|nr:DUF2203 domain-containing protein [Verrucomicrobiae bacterium]
MNYQFRKHYTRDQARKLLPQVREWLETLAGLRRELGIYEQRLDALMQPGCDAGGRTVNDWIRLLARMRDVLVEFQKREIQIKDLERGLVDFPAIIGEKEVFLCWEKDEDDIEFWHDIDSGYAGRERL